MDDAFNQGLISFRIGVSRLHNPFDGTNLEYFWDLGWRFGFEVKEPIKVS